MAGRNKEKRMNPLDSHLNTLWVTLYPDLKTNRGAVGAFQDKTYCKIIANNDIEMKFSLYVSECMYSPKQLFWCGKSRNNPGCATEFGAFYTAMLFHFFCFFRAHNTPF
jgi:hypothetical protein